MLCNQPKNLKFFQGAVVRSGREGGCHKKADRCVQGGGGGSVKCVHTQCNIMPVFIVKQHTASPFEYFYQNELADEILLGLGQLATDHC